jgi:hypothetical protein
VHSQLKRAVEQSRRGDQLVDQPDLERRFGAERATVETEPKRASGA